MGCLPLFYGQGAIIHPLPDSAHFIQANVPFVRLPNATLLNFIIEEAPFCFGLDGNKVTTLSFAGFSVVGPCCG